MDKLTLGTRNVSIEFPGVKALTDVNFEVSTGEIRALVGANGAGKSTLMKVFAGANPDYTGEVYLNDKVVELRTPMAAKKLGIQIVYQEVDMALVPTLSVAENVMHIAVEQGAEEGLPFAPYPHQRAFRTFTAPVGASPFGNLRAQIPSFPLKISVLLA